MSNLFTLEPRARDHPRIKTQDKYDLSNVFGFATYLLFILVKLNNNTAKKINISINSFLGFITTFIL